MDLGNAFALATQIGMYSAAALGLYLTARGTFYTVPQQHTGLVTRFGEHVRTNETPGLKTKIPLIERVAKISQQEYQTKEMLETKTADDLFVKLPISIHYEVSDPAVFHFNKDKPVALMSNVVSAAVREYTSQKKFQELYNERQQIKDGVLAKVADKVGGFGIHINDIVIDEPQASQEVKHTFDRVRSSALEKEAATNEAAADYIRTVKRAEADKERNILIGEGVAGFREKVASGYASIRQKLVGDGVDPIAAERFMEEAMRLDTLRDIGDKGHMVIVTPDAGTGSRIAELQTLSRTTEQNNTPRAPRAVPVAEVAAPASP
jgi:membrane protease subunit HflC